MGFLFCFVFNKNDLEYHAEEFGFYSEIEEKGS